MLRKASMNRITMVQPTKIISLAKVVANRRMERREQRTYLLTTTDMMMIKVTTRSSLETTLAIDMRFKNSLGRARLELPCDALTTKTRGSWR